MQNSSSYLIHTEKLTNLLNQCVHCGLCLQTCPTYRLLGLEMDSPRGRISLIRAAATRRLDEADIEGTFKEHIDLCLACRACETACPSGVQYGQLIEPARVLIQMHTKPGLGETFVRWLGLKQLLPYPGRLRFLAVILKVYQLLGIQWLVRKLNILPANLMAMEGLLPPLRKKYKPGLSTSTQSDRGIVLMFTGCIQEGFLDDINQATIRVLQRNGFRVIVPKGQTCCGAAHSHLGEIEQARELARKNIDIFLKNPTCDAIISNAGGCGLAMKEYTHLLADDPIYYPKAVEFSGKVFDISEFLSNNLYCKPTRQIREKAVFVDSCHLRHGQSVIEQPRRLIGEIPGLELVELNHPDQCCGSAGVYNIAHPEIAKPILKSKMEDIFATGAQLIVTANTGCHLQMLAGIHQSRSQARVLHVMELLDMAYE